MPGEASKKQTNAQKNGSQEERRSRQRRQRDENPQKERRRRQRRGELQQWPGENMQSGASQAQKAEGRTPEQQSVPAKRRGQEQRREQPSRTPGAAEMKFGPVFHPFDHLKDSSGLNIEIGTAEAGGRESDRPTRLPGSESGEGEEEDFGESYDRPFGGHKAGGKVDSSQRDMGQTGQTMEGGCGGPMSTQQGPYGPQEKHRGPIARGKPLMDDWGKSEKH